MTSKRWKHTHTGLIRARKSLAVAYIAQAKGYEWWPHLFGGDEHFEKDGQRFIGQDIVTLKEIRRFDGLIDKEMLPEEAARKVVSQ